MNTMTCSVRVKFNVGEIEASGENTNVVAELVNRATKKFFPNTTLLEDM